jgi:uncharacterized lipoprotein NlpE involved in copper resistance
MNQNKSKSLATGILAGLVLTAFSIGCNNDAGDSKEAKKIFLAVQKVDSPAAPKVADSPAAAPAKSDTPKNG